MLRTVIGRGETRRIDREKIEGNGTKPRKEHCREDLSRGKKNEDSGEKSRRVKRRERCGSGKVRGNEV